VKTHTKTQTSTVFRLYLGQNHEQGYSDLKIVPIGTRRKKHCELGPNISRGLINK